MKKKLSYLHKKDVIKAIEYKYPSRIPMNIKFWIFDLEDRDDKDKIKELNQKYPQDFFVFMPTMPGYHKSSLKNYSNYKWYNMNDRSNNDKGLDSQQLLPDWNDLDIFLKNFPDPNLDSILDSAKLRVEKDNTERYKLAHFAYFFYERLWSFRGMDNSLMDFYLYPKKVKKLFELLANFYKKIIERCDTEIGCDGLLVTDDLGTQNGLMFSPEIFREFFKPFYSEVITECKKRDLHFWLHSCGNIEEIMDDLIEIGVDVIHPIQKYAMDFDKIARKYSGEICFWVGMDVQKILPRGTKDEVRREVRSIIDLFDSSSGGMMITAGNGITNDIPYENLKAFYDEAYYYGLEHRKK